MSKNKQKELILHVGFHKTGSTVIQDTMGLNIKSLNKLGYKTVPFTGSFDAGHLNHSVPMSIIFDKFSDKYRHSDKHSKVLSKILKDKLTQSMQQNNNLIVSGEDISKLSNESLNQIKKEFELNEFNIRVIVFVRDPQSYFQSRVQQAVRGGYYLSELNKSYDLLGQMRKIEQVFDGQTEFHSFKFAKLHQHGVAGYFLETILGINEKELERFSIIKFGNVSWNQQAVRLLSYINKSLPVFIRGLPDVNTCHLRIDRDIIVLARIRGDKFAILKNEISFLQDELSATHATLCDRFGEDFLDPIKPLSDFPETYTWEEISIQSLEDILPKLNTIILGKVFEYFFDLYRNNEIDESVLNRIGKQVQSIIKEREAYLTQDNVDLLRNSALTLEKTDIQKAHDLMELAHKGRPDGTLIKERLARYKSQIKKNIGNKT